MQAAKKLTERKELEIAIISHRPDKLSMFWSYRTMASYDRPL
jgi:hypothetical protein